MDFPDGQYFALDRAITPDVLYPHRGDSITLEQHPYETFLYLRFRSRGRSMGDLLALMHRFRWEIDAAIKQAEIQYAEERAKAAQEA